ncbi:MAG TPA: YHS domain-containing protein [Gammaproteobacteria bacterium]|nr:YHS domain-containing protein [Gammaproteobacteria bacterium]
MKDQYKTTDPVCLMEVERSSLEHEYQGKSYSFCSQQCHDRFEANPHLYIGRPGKPSPKQQGRSVIRKRTLKLETSVPDHVRHHIKDMLGKMMGIKTVSIENNTIQITYDLLEVTAQQIEDALEKNGENLSNTLSTKLQKAFFHYLEETELDNLEQGDDSHGCHSIKKE